MTFLLVVSKRLVLKRFVLFGCLQPLVIGYELLLCVDGSPASGETFKRIDKADLVVKMIEIVGKCTDPSHEQGESLLC